MAELRPTAHGALRGAPLESRHGRSSRRTHEGRVVEREPVAAWMHMDWRLRRAALGISRWVVGLTRAWAAPRQLFEQPRAPFPGFSHQATALRYKPCKVDLRAAISYVLLIEDLSAAR
eukprot:scaffold58440_cov48-Phaeocystis_antarctica.AAC.1